MSAYDLPQESDLTITSRKAAQSARRRLNGADLGLQDTEDMILAATPAYRRHHQAGLSIPFCFACARQAVEKYFCR
jgi:hypothetical protein